MWWFLLPNRIRIYAAIGLMMAATLALGSCGQKSKETFQTTCSQSAIVVNDQAAPIQAKWDFGILAVGTHQKHAFRLVNATGKALIVKAEDTSPRCLSILESPALIQPGDVGTVLVQLDTSHLYGNIVGVARLHSGTPGGAVLLSLRADVRNPEHFPAAKVVEPEHDFGTVEPGTKTKHTFSVANAGRSALVLGKPRGSCGSCISASVPSCK
jgi:hypothetical protein